MAACPAARPVVSASIAVVSVSILAAVASKVSVAAIIVAWPASKVSVSSRIEATLEAISPKGSSLTNVAVGDETSGEVVSFKREV